MHMHKYHKCSEPSFHVSYTHIQQSSLPGIHDVEMIPVTQAHIVQLN